MKTLPAESMAPGASCMPTMSELARSSTASDCVHWVGSALPDAGAVATHTRVAATTLTSNGPVTDAAQPPPAGCAPRVPKTAYTRPLDWLTKMFEGPPESAHWRSTYACEPGCVTGTGTPKSAPSSV